MSEAPPEPQPFDLDKPFELPLASDDAEQPPEPRSRSRIRRVLIASLLGIVLAGVAGLGWAWWQMSSQNDATLSTPPQIGGLRLDDSANGKETADYLQTALSAEITLRETTGAVYADGSNGSVLFFGGTATIWSPEKALDSAFGLISDKQGAVTGLHDVDAGKLGGTMKCGITNSDGGTLPVCGWADHGSLALAMFPGRSEPDSAALLRQIRDATEVRH